MGKYSYFFKIIINCYLNFNSNYYQSEPAIHRIIVAFGYDNLFLEYMDAICVSIQGFLNACVWLSDPYFRSRIKQAPFCLRLMVYIIIMNNIIVILILFFTFSIVL